MALVVAHVIADWPGLSGVYQVTSDPISKYDLLRLIRDAYTLDITIDADDTECCDRSMLGARFESSTGWRAPSWPEMVRQLAADTTPYADWGVLVRESQQRELRNV